MNAAAVYGGRLCARAYNIGRAQPKQPRQDLCAGCAGCAAAQPAQPNPLPLSGTSPDEPTPRRTPAERQPTMKKLVAIRSQARALTQPPRKSPPAKAPPPSKAEKGFLQAAAFKRKFPLLASTPSAKRKARQAATAYGAELSRKGGKR